MTNVVPPPITRASSPCFCSSSTASGNERGRNNSNERIVTMVPHDIVVWFYPSL
jgi:hypothetical protein